MKLHFLKSGLIVAGVAMTFGSYALAAKPEAALKTSRMAVPVIREEAAAGSIRDRANLACGIVTASDPDGNLYHSVQIGAQCWLKENLKSKSKPNGDCINGGSAPCPEASSSDNGLGRSCIDNDEMNCAAYGALYSWNAAMNGSTTDGAQGICPSGWHVPTSAEQHTLAAYTNNPAMDNCDDIDFLGGGGCSAAELRAGHGSGFMTYQLGWNYVSESGFDAYWTGYRLADGSSFDLSDFDPSPLPGGGNGGAAMYWSSTAVLKSSSAYKHYWFGFDLVDGGVAFRGVESKAAGLSLRCIRN